MQREIASLHFVPLAMTRAITRLYVVIARIPASLRSVSDEAIQHGRAIKLDCFAKLAMTRLSALAELPLARE
jgi:hypothetical protein